MKKIVKTWSTPIRTVENEKVPCSLCGGSVFLPELDCEGFNFVRCKNCGLVQMNPQPAENEITARYVTDHGKDYLNYELDNEDKFLELQQLALKDIGFKYHNGANRRFLDIGCATGALLAFLQNHGWNVTGVEISPGAKYAVEHRNLDVKNIPLEECNFASGSFDVVHASHLIEHLKNPRAFLEEVHRILKKDGCVYISTPNITGFQALFFKNHWRSAIFDHLYLFSKKTLKKLLKNTGYKVKQIRTWGGLAAGTAPNWLKNIIDMLVKKLNVGDVMIIKAIKSKP